MNCNGNIIQLLFSHPLSCLSLLRGMDCPCSQNLDFRIGFRRDPQVWQRRESRRFRDRYNVSRMWDLQITNHLPKWDVVFASRIGELGKSCFNSTLLLCRYLYLRNSLCTFHPGKTRLLSTATMTVHRRKNQDLLKKQPVHTCLFAETTDFDLSNVSP